MAEEYKDEGKGGGYYGKGGKSKIWMWILIYLVVAAIIYYIIYAVVKARRAENPNPGTQNSGSLY